MQAKLNIPFPDDLKPISGSALVTQLVQEIELHKLQIGYLIQDYYPKQKVRVAELIFNRSNLSELFVKFSLEEFSSCAAIDTYELAGMKLQVTFDTNSQMIELVGEEWSE